MAYSFVHSFSKPIDALQNNSFGAKINKNQTQLILNESNNVKVSFNVDKISRNCNTYATDFKTIEHKRV